MNNENKGTRMVTPTGKAAFVSLDSTEVIDGKDTGKYAVSLILDPKNEEAAKFISAVNEMNTKANTENTPKGKKYETPTIVKPHLKKAEDGTLVDSGLVRITARSKYQANVYSPDKTRLEAGAVKGGDSIRLQITAMPFSMPGNKKAGITLYVSDILLVESAGSGVPEDLFAGIEAKESREDAETAFSF